MRLRVLAVGQKMPAWVNEGCKNTHAECPAISLWSGSMSPCQARYELCPAISGTGSGRHIVKLGKSGQMVALDVAGREISTELIAERFGQWQMNGEQISFVIGDPTDCTKRFCSVPLNAGLWTTLPCRTRSLG